MLVCAVRYADPVALAPWEILSPHQLPGLISLVDPAPPFDVRGLHDPAVIIDPEPFLDLTAFGREGALVEPLGRGRGRLRLLPRGDVQLAHGCAPSGVSVPTASPAAP